MGKKRVDILVIISISHSMSPMNHTQNYHLTTFYLFLIYIIRCNPHKKVNKAIRNFFYLVTTHEKYIYIIDGTVYIIPIIWLNILTHTWAALNIIRHNKNSRFGTEKFSNFFRSLVLHEQSIENKMDKSSFYCGFHFNIIYFNGDNLYDSMSATVVNPLGDME